MTLKVILHFIKTIYVFKKVVFAFFFYQNLSINECAGKNLSKLRKAILVELRKDGFFLCDIEEFTFFIKGL